MLWMAASPCSTIAQATFKVQHLTPKDGLSYRWAFDVTQDSIGQIWIATFDGINRYDGHRFSVYRPYFPDFPDFESRVIAQVDCLPGGEIWTTSKQGILTRLSRVEDRFELIWPQADRKFPLKARPLSAPDGSYPLGLLGAENTSQEWFARLSLPHHFDSLVALSSPMFLRKHIMPLLDGKHFWIYSDRHYIILNPDTRQYDTYPFHTIPGAAIAHPSLPIDEQSRFWFPAAQGGFSSFQLPPAIPLRSWEHFKLDNKGNFWIWTQDKTTYRYTPAGDKLEHFGRFDFWEHEIGFPFEDREGVIWIPHFYGVTKLMQPRRLFDNYLHEPLNALGAAPGGKSVYTILEAKDGSIYIQAYGNPPFRLRPGASAPEAVAGLPQGLLPGDGALAKALGKQLREAGYNVHGELIYFHDVAQRSMWLCRKSSRDVFYVDTERPEQHRRFEISPAAQGMIVLLPYDGYLWIGADNGLHRLDPQSGKTRRYTTREGLPHNIIYSILPDGPNLWLGTHYGLCRFSIRSGQTKNYYVEDGLTQNEFNTRSALRAGDGKLFFGGLNGANAFYPADLERATPRYQAGLHLSRFSKLEAGRDSTISSYQPDLLNTLRLRPGDRSLSFEFSINSHVNPTQNRYWYYLDGLETEWSNATNDGRASYSHLPPGLYTFRVKAADPFGNPATNEITLPILMPQVWYRRWWAWSLYTLVLMAVGYRLYRLRLHQHLERREALRLQELDEMKTKLYTNITHEFRTPLTVILGTSEHIENQAPDNVFPDLETANSFAAGLKSRLALIRRNGRSLLDLVNQLLDLAKAENKQLKTDMVQGDVVQYVRYIAESFHSLANYSNVMLRVETRLPELIMDFDPEKMRQILSNLISNALKYTPSGGKVTLRIGKDESAGTPAMILEVSDTGQGISAEDLPHIFDRFYQADNTVTKAGPTGAGGTGIGLALIKELVNLLEGNIAVHSEPDKGAEFTVRLPISNKSKTRDVYIASSPDSLPDTITRNPRPTTRNRPSILIIEDNPDVLEYLRMCLQDHYAIHFSYNGRSGIDMALELVPDLILSDVMMPEKDGFEVCDTLKNDERSSHIPLVLLTAKADMESRIAGLRRGADAYLTKPFHPEELSVTLEKLLENRRRLQEYYSRFSLALPANQVETANTETELEDAFLHKLRSAVEARMDDASLSADDICRGVGMSRSNLYAKLSALTGLSFNIYVRRLRLHKARHLLETSEMNVSEVAFETGFNDPKYFSRVFSEEFGMPPSEVPKM